MKLAALAAVSAALALAITHGAVVVTGGSMEPTLSPGDVCVYRKTPEVRPGQVVVLERDGGTLVVHRAVTVGLRGEVRSRGDANEFNDPGVVPAALIRGPVVAAFPIGRLVRH